MAGCMSELLVMLRRVRAAGLHSEMPSETDKPEKAERNFNFFLIYFEK